MPKTSIENATGLIAFSADEMTAEEFNVQVDEYSRKLESDGFSYTVEMQSDTSDIFKNVTKKEDA